ncbi:MAG TPA: Mur ligase family protein [Candidatus Saccharimonadales bacterium]|nr:Mur ligase family protein [Candidatus Saccharimonadales bacterium]
MLNLLLIFFGKSISSISKLLNLGNGSTWPGHIALLANKKFIRDITKNFPLKIVVVAGTNGKTTTGKMITTILQEDKKHVFQNTAGANLLNGIASTLLLHTNVFGKINKGYAIFEIDENVLPLFLNELTPHAIILLNLFRDQLDRYGEIDTIAKKWQTALATLPGTTTVYLNADDPQIAYLGESLCTDVQYFGLEEKSVQKTLQHASDSIYCPNCHTKLMYKRIYYSHLGDWHCPSCKLKRPMPNISITYFPLSGDYNKYNTLAAALFAKNEGIKNTIIEKALKKVKPAFGRQEIIEIDDKKAQIFLSKNPTSFNQSLDTIKHLGGKTVLLILNDRIPDGRDISWIWDIDIEEYMDNFENIIVTGDRVYDMALRMQYIQNSQKENTKFTIYENLEDAVQQSLLLIKPNEVLYILPTYSAMLEIRKILTGKKIL